MTHPASHDPDCGPLRVLLSVRLEPTITPVGAKVTMRKAEAISAHAHMALQTVSQQDSVVDSDALADGVMDGIKEEDSFLYSRRLVIEHQVVGGCPPYAVRLTVRGPDLAVDLTRQPARGRNAFARTREYTRHDFASQRYDVVVSARDCHDTAQCTRTLEL